MAPQYDVTLSDINLVSFESPFQETLGGDYQLVGSAVMPGPPMPLGFYTVTIGVYGDIGESDPYTQGAALRNAVRSLIQNDAVRYAGVNFSTTFDDQITGYIVIGSANLDYGQGNTVVNDFVLSLSNVAHIGAQQTLLSVHRLVVADRTKLGTTLDHKGNVQRRQPVKVTWSARSIR
jgi:hypothetical protein